MRGQPPPRHHHRTTKMRVWVGCFWMHSAFLPEWVVKVVDGVIVVIDVVIVIVMDVGVEISSLTLP